MPPASTIGPSKKARTARTNTNGIEPAGLAAGARRQEHEAIGAGRDRALGVADAGDVGKHQRAGVMQRAPRTGAGEPTEVMTISGL